MYKMFRRSAATEYSESVVALQFFVKVIVWKSGRVNKAINNPDCLPCKILILVHAGQSDIYI